MIEMLINNYSRGRNLIATPILTINVWPYIDLLFG